MNEMIERTYTGQQMVEEVEAENKLHEQIFIDQIQWAMWYFRDPKISPDP